MTSEKQAQKFHTDDASEAWVVLLIGCAMCEICFSQSEALPRPDLGSEAYGISLDVAQTSFWGETSDGVTKCRLFSQGKAATKMPQKPRMPSVSTLIYRGQARLQSNVLGEPRSRTIDAKVSSILRPQTFSWGGGRSGVIG